MLDKVIKQNKPTENAIARSMVFILQLIYGDY